MLLNHIRGVLDGVACLLVGSGLFEDVGCHDIAEVMWTVAEQYLERTSAGPGGLDSSWPPRVRTPMQFPQSLQGTRPRREICEGGRFRAQFGAGSARSEEADQGLYPRQLANPLFALLDFLVYPSHLGPMLTKRFHIVRKRMCLIAGR